MNVAFAGGCVCGAIRDECSAEPLMMFKCHCRDCQRVTGGGFVAGLLVPAAAFRLTKGQLRYHFTTSLAGGKHKRGFCADCGSRLTGAESDERPTLSASPPAVWTIQAGFARKWIFSCRTHNRGTTWTRPFRSMISIRRCLRAHKASTQARYRKGACLCRLRRGG